MSKKRADFLFATPCASFGVARLVDFGGTFDAYNTSEGEREADMKATVADWRAVGDSLTDALELLELG